MKRTVELVPCTIFLLCCVAGCAHKYAMEPQREAGANTLTSSSRVYVALPAPGHYGQEVYEQSGAQTRDAIVALLAPRSAAVEFGSVPEEDAAALVSARAMQADRAVVPRIEHWEERATEWSGKPDRIIVDIRIYDVASSKILAAADVSGISRWGTWGGDHPQDLLPQAIGDYLETIR